VIDAVMSAHSDGRGIVVCIRRQRPHLSHGVLQLQNSVSLKRGPLVGELL
jgi:hypothetical protein